MVYFTMNLYLKEHLQNSDDPARIILNVLSREWKYKLGIYKHHGLTEYELHSPYLMKGRK